ncbi:MAG: hypothetical protein H6512_02310 [Acidimicrobiia bacterium]|nr:hypothetical protein [Acidimicrobiia bacterium]
MTQSVDRQRRWGEVDGREIMFPLVVESMNQAVLTYTVPAAVAQMLVPGGGYTVTEDDDGNAQFVLALVDYVDNPWGDYQEVNFGFLAHPTGSRKRTVRSSTGCRSTRNSPQRRATRSSVCPRPLSASPLSTPTMRSRLRCGWRAVSSSP